MDIKNPYQNLLMDIDLSIKQHRRFRKVSTQIWYDKKFLALSNEAKLIWFLLLSHPAMTSLGAMHGSQAGLAPYLRLSEKKFSKYFKEIIESEMVAYDHAGNFVGLPKFLKHNVPESPNVIRSWIKALDCIPECDLKLKLMEASARFVEYLPQGFREALPKVFRKTYLNQEQEQEQEQEEKIKIPCEVENVFSHWQLTMNHRDAKLDEKRKKLIRNALKTGYTTEQLCEAITGCSLTPHNIGKNDRNQRYDGLHIILRNADQIDRFIQNSRTPPISKNGDSHATNGKTFSQLRAESYAKFTAKAFGKNPETTS
jgi:hypothetical protein